MHPRNPYRNNPPDFKELSRKYPSLHSFVRKKRGHGSDQNEDDTDERCYIDFKDPKALRELTCCLLHCDFGLTVKFPIDALCPTVPNRLNYICWIEDLVHPPKHRQSSESRRSIRGLDIGTGASCIYPLLACARNKDWTFVASEIDPRSCQYARTNIDDSKSVVGDRITVFENPTPKLILPLGLLDSRSKPRFSEESSRTESTDSYAFDFCMCNPPFYSDGQEIIDSLQAKADLPMGSCTGTESEMIFKDGGEAGFVKQMIDESLADPWSTSVRWFSSMLGKRASLDIVVGHLKENGISNYTLTSLTQGQTVRGVVAWSFSSERIPWEIACQEPKRISHLTAPTTTITFQDTESNDVALSTSRIVGLLKSMSISHEVADDQSSYFEIDPSPRDLPSPSSAIQKVEGIKVISGQANCNTWSRAARRAIARGLPVTPGNSVVVGFEIRVSVPPVVAKNVLPLSPLDSGSEETTRRSIEIKDTVEAEDGREGCPIAVHWIQGTDRQSFETLAHSLKSQLGRRP